MHPFVAAPCPHLFGHRGASGEAPENTLAAFEKALAQGVPFLEMDCHATLDGEIVVCHDPRLERTTDGTGEIRAWRFRDLARLDAGYQFTPDGHSYPYRGRKLGIPRLRDVLEAFPRARVNLEVKQSEPSIAEAVVELVGRAGAESRMLLAAEDDALMGALRALRPGTATGASRGEVIGFYRALAEGGLGSYEPPGDALQIPTSFMGNPLVTEQSLQAAHAVGLCIHVWTVNAPDEMRELLELGVDGIMSDFPGRLVDAARAAAR
jgi:glycerophosphoryl diester phosphodiesterase